ncbi:chemotaxis protein CheA [Sphingomonas baiyangensis]|uniref:Chemotaxis protein CheA n=1 Tax=Sphingomonas baiyangensis TaxID=2572576 RepID=A0A4U1L4V7_9SPHN|nr:chemotaxis protein CheA [Sphingomonas baiyangensis]TKD51584.1 chemotaxis protein CheA [Sphingomonas baiyangensis]
MSPDDIQSIFFQECEEGLASAETALLAIKAGEHDGETINTIFRAVHSIKGGAGAFGFHPLQSFTHLFETLLDKVRDGELSLDPPLVELLMGAFDVLADHVTAIRGEGEQPDDAVMKRALRDALSAAPASAPGLASQELGLSFDIDAMMAELTVRSDIPAQDWRVTFMPAAGDLAHGGEPLLLLRELAALGGQVVSADPDRVPTLDAFDPDAAYMGWTLRLPATAERATIEEVFDFVSDPGSVTIERTQFDDAMRSAREVILQSRPVAPLATPAAEPPVAQAPLAAKQPKVAVGATIRVDLDKLDRLVDLVGELVITQSMLSQRLASNGLAAVEELADLDQLTRELQDSAMAIRAQPVKSVFSRVPRIVRELEASTGKRVQIEVEGEATELDKTVIERIGEPLTHLVRNCVDHGIELPAQRLAKGKPAEGLLRLSAEHKGSRIVISVSDDGAGIDRERVLAIATDRGIVAADARLSDEEIEQLIFAPGFSTAREVSNISGRGVGMDVVRQNVQALGGRITIQSRPGEGSSFALALPLTLAIVDGMVVSVGDQTYIIPLTHIVESLRPDRDQVQSTGLGNRVLNVRGAFLPVLGIGDQLGLTGAVSEPSEAVLIVVETESAGSAILMVDAIIDQRQVVIKSLETHYQQVEGVAGATILGDGRVALILDVEGLVDLRAPVPLRCAS